MQAKEKDEEKRKREREEKEDEEEKREREREENIINYLPFSAVVIEAADEAHLHILTYTIKNIKSKTMRYKEEEKKQQQQQQ